MLQHLRRDALNLFQLILNPIRDWNAMQRYGKHRILEFQLILNPIRDWNSNLISVFSPPFGSN